MQRFAPFLALLLAAACAFPTPSFTVTGPVPVELPFRVAADGLVLIRGRVNGTQDIDFILDTGAPVTVLIDNAHTRGLRLDTSGARRLGGDDPASPTGVIRGGQSIDFGRVAIGGLTAVIIPGASLPCPERFEAIGFGGVIGADLFRRFVVEIDWRARLVRLHEPAGWQPPAGLAAVALDFEDGHPYVQSTIHLPDGRRVATRLHLDTGMNLGLSLTTGASSPFAAPADGKQRTTCFVSARSFAMEGAPVAVEVGGVRFGGVTPVYSPAEGASSTRRTGALGAAALSRQALVVDYARRRILVGTSP
jgi:hypothetical protein